MKRTICALLAALIALSLAACGTGTGGKQTASAYLDQSGDAAVEVTVDLSGGWSVEFTRGAAYLYDGEIREGKESAAMLITLDRDLYDERMAHAAEDGNRKEANGGVYYTRDGAKTYLASVSGAAFVQITAYGKTDSEAVVARFSHALDR